MSSASEPGTVRQCLMAMRTPGVGRFAPLAGLGAGALCGAVYWLAAQLWPSSVAMILAMLTGALLTGDLRQPAAEGGLQSPSLLFYVLLKYNVLMALSAAKLPFDAPANTALCLVMICGYGASRSLLVCLLASRSHRMRSEPPSQLDLGIALLLGFAPALLLGMPGLIGLAAAVASIIGLFAAPRRAVNLAPWIAETSFYLGALAGWSYV